MKAMVRGQLGALSDQESGILDVEATDFIHQGIIAVRTLLGSLIDPFYETEETLGSILITSGEGSISVAASQIFNINKVKLTDPTIKKIVVKRVDEYNAIKGLYTPAEIGTTNAVAALIATVTGTAPALVPTLKIFIYTGASGTLTTVKIHYPRYPTKVTVDADTLDIPEPYSQLVRDVSTLYMAKRLAKQPSPDVVNSVSAVLNPLMATMGLNITPNAGQMK
jgi:hypothetical protein